MYESFSIIFAIAALLSYINYKWIKLPNTIAQLIMALSLAIIVISSQSCFPSVYNFFCDIVLNADFTVILLDVLLGFLLFAGALHVDVNELEKERRTIILFAVIGVLISTFIVGTGLFYIAQFFACELPYLHCLLFGALISPTDPIAVLSLLDSTGVSESLKLKIEGESLFNDGIGVIVFTGILLVSGMGDMLNHDADQNLLWELVRLFAGEVLLGLALGLALGYIGYKLMKSSEDDKYLSTIISLAVVFGGFSLAEILHTSGPLAMVVAGLYIGNAIKHPKFKHKAKDSLVGFWYILDESLNGVIFVFLGLAIHLIHIENSSYLILAICSVLLVLIARFISVWLPYSLLKHHETSWSHTTYVLTWGGLKGAISLALAFSLAPEYSRNTILLLTYATVLFSILVQGLTLSKLIKKIY